MDNEEERELVTSAFTICDSNLPETEWRNTSDGKLKIKEILSDPLFQNKQLIELFNNLSVVRNDINHSGMRSKRLPMRSKSIRDNIEKCINGFSELLLNDDTETETPH
jgi:hypothetical protein